MLSILALISLSAFAGTTPTLYTYTYQATVTAGSVSCQNEAQNLASRFEKATGLTAKSVVCRGEQETQNGKTYLLGLAYKAASQYQPYTVEIGKGDLYSGHLDEVAIYPNAQACLDDVATQTEAYEENTKLKSVATTCVKDPAAIDNRYFMKIEGFAKKPWAEPAQRLYTFSPFAFYYLDQDRSGEVRDFLSHYDVTIVKQVGHSYTYYRKGYAAPVKSELLGASKSAEDCAVQLPAAEELLTKVESPRSVVWCSKNRLVSLREGTFSFFETRPADVATYSTIQQCMNDREFVLSDSRNRGALGALCSQSIYDSKVYEMILYRKSY